MEENLADNSPTNCTAFTVTSVITAGIWGPELHTAKKVLFISGLLTEAKTVFAVFTDTLIDSFFSLWHRFQSRTNYSSRPDLK